MPRVCRRSAWPPRPWPSPWDARRCSRPAWVRPRRWGFRSKFSRPPGDSHQCGSRGFSPWRRTRPLAWSHFPPGAWPVFCGHCPARPGRRHLSNDNRNSADTRRRRSSPQLRWRRICDRGSARSPSSGRGMPWSKHRSGCVRGCTRRRGCPPANGSPRRDAKSPPPLPIHSREWQGRGAAV